MSDEVILEDPYSLIHLLKQSISKDVTNDMKKEVFSNNSNNDYHKFYTQKSGSTNVNSSDSMEVIILDNSDDNKHKVYSEKSGSTNVESSNSMEVVVLDESDDKQHKVYSEKSDSTNVNSSDRMEVVVLDDTDDEQHNVYSEKSGSTNVESSNSMEVVVSDESDDKQYKVSEKSGSANVKSWKFHNLEVVLGDKHSEKSDSTKVNSSDRMEVVVLDDTDDKRHKVYSEKDKTMSSFSLGQSHIVRNELHNQTATVSRTSQHLPSRVLSEHMDVEYTSYVCDQKSRIEDEYYAAVENSRRKPETEGEISVLNRFVEIENAFDGSVRTFYYKNEKEDCKDVRSLLTYLHLIIKHILYNMITLYSVVKFNIIVECTYKKPVENELKNVMLKTKNSTLYYSTSLGSIIDNIIKEILEVESTSMDLSSIWTILRINGILLRFTHHKPLRGGSYIRLPTFLTLKRCILNPKNLKDEYCFKWAILSRYIKRNAARLNQRYFDLEHKFNFKDIDFPTPLNQIERFEKNNNISINVYGIDKNKLIFPLKVCSEEKPEHFDLLLLNNKSGQYHYCYIRSMARLVTRQINKGHSRVDICKRCLSSFRANLKNLEPHKAHCGKYIPRKIRMPTKNTNTLKFKHFHHKFRVPVVAYANFECVLKSSDPSYVPSFSNRNECHDPASFCVYFVIDNDIPEDIKIKLPTEPYIYRGNYVAQKFMSYITRVVDLFGIFMKDIKPLKMEKNDTAHFTSAKHCELCNCKFTKSVKRVRDYCHLTGKFRSVLCSACNLQRQKQRFVPIFIHTRSNYEFHFLIHQLADNIRNIHVTADSNEKYIYFTKTASTGLFIRFIDVNHFLNDSLDLLSSDISKDQFYHTNNFFSIHDMPLITRKYVYPYEYTNACQKFEECQLPPKDKFCSKSQWSNINDEEYEHAIKMWHHFNIKSLGEYGDLLLKVDVLWVCDIFENIRTLCLSTYKLDCVYYFSISNFSFNTMLNCTKMELELVTDNDMYTFLEQGMRNGICRCVKSVSVANNQYIKETFDASRPVKFLPYLQVNDLYGWAMCKCIPFGGFLWRNLDDNLDILNVADDALVGFILEVDIEYPQQLYDQHSDLPFLFVNDSVNGTSQETLQSLRTTQLSKKNYVCHYVNLKQAVSHGLKITKIHRILQFYQSPWLKSFIKLNSEKQYKAKNNYEKDFIKLINNSVIEKLTENVKKQLRVNFVNNEKSLQKYIVYPTFKDRIIYNNSLCAIVSLKNIINCNKPIYIGFTILELSKTLIYEFHYDVLKKKYDKNISLLCVDNDSLLYEVKTDDFYKDIIDPDLSSHFDIFENTPNYPHYTSKKFLRKFKEKCKRTPVKEFASVRAKLYSVETSNSDI